MRGWCITTEFVREIRQKRHLAVGEEYSFSGNAIDSLPVGSGGKGGKDGSLLVADPPLQRDDQSLGGQEFNASAPQFLVPGDGLQIPTYDPGNLG